MFNTIILFVTAVVGFLCSASIIGKNIYREHSLINKYLIIITTFNAIRYLFHGLAEANPQIDISNFVNLLDVCFIMLMPCFYLYFTNIIYENKFVLGNLFHFIVPFLLGTLFLTYMYSSPDNADWIFKLFIIFVFSCYIFYIIFTFIILYKHVWRRKTYIKAIQKQNDLIKNWSLFLYIAFVLICFIRITFTFISFKYGIPINHYLWVSSLLWIGIFVKIILSPDILYGYNLLNKTISTAREKRLALGNVWNLEGTVLPVASEKDKKLEEKMKALLKEYLYQMEEFSFNTQAFRNPDLSPEDIAAALKIPISHIHFILKFHCNESFTDYKKIVRIHDATKLLEDGYLNDHKVETLSTTVGFSSYNTFSIAFKNITGVTTQEYVKRF